MIKLSDKKTDIKEQLKTEELNINVLIAFQEKLRDSVINYSKKIIQESFTDINSEKLNDVSDSFLDISKALKKSESIIDTCNQLKETFELLLIDLDGATTSVQKNKIEEYNKNFTTLNRKINSETNELQTFISNYEKNEILKQFLEKDNELISENNSSESNTIQLDDKSDIEELETVEEDTNTNSSSPEQFDSILEEYSKDTSEPEPEPEIEIELPSEENSNTDNIIKGIDNLEDIEESEKDLEEDLEENKDNYIKNIYDEKKSDFTIIEDDNSDYPPTPDEEYNFVEKTLFISERENSVTLPYTIDELKSKLKSNPEQYKSLQDVIKQEYIVPLNYYRSPAISRFKEAYRLVRNKDHGSFRHAIDLAAEMFFKSNLHPAIITACKNTDELDIYLSCLEFDELEDFKIFKIIFEILPKEIKKRLKASS